MINYVKFEFKSFVKRNWILESFEKGRCSIGNRREIRIKICLEHKDFMRSSHL